MDYRSRIKTYAKERLKSQYGTTLGACFLVFLPQLVIAIATAILAGYAAIALYYYDARTASFITNLSTSISRITDVVPYLLMPFSAVGLSSFMLCAVRGMRKQVSYPYVFGAKGYARYLGGMLWQNLFLGLWMCLFLIPGIVKSYAYSFNQYILADCPNLTVRQALNLSKKMTDGIKGEIFVFELSFIGWWILTALTCGILAIYTVPYYFTAKAALYESMKKSSLIHGRITESDLDPALVNRYENYSQN